MLLFWESVKNIFTAVSVWELLLIFISRIIEVSLGTLRIILVNKGYRKQGSILSFFEVMIWVLVASRVINGINEQPLKAIIYSLGFAAGVYLGSVLENILAFGRVLIQVITTVDMGKIIVQTLRGEGIAVTTVDARGKDTEKTVLMIYANRRGNDDIINKVLEIDNKAMVVSNDVSTLHGGYITARSWKRFIK